MIGTTKTFYITDSMVKRILNKSQSLRTAREDSIVELYSNGIRTRTFGVFVRDDNHLVNGWWLRNGLCWEEHVLNNKRLGRIVKPYNYNKIITKYEKFKDISYYKKEIYYDN